MMESELFGCAVNALKNELAVVDHDGWIIGVNRAWTRFAQVNGGSPQLQRGIGLNYLAACEASAATRPEAAQAMRGIRAVLDGYLDEFEMYYWCPSFALNKRLWCNMQVTTIESLPGHAVINHTDLTRRKAVERRLLRRVRRLSEQMTDIEQTERRRLASQLHDHLQQLLVASRLALQSGAFKDLEPALSDRIGQATNYLDEAITATRALSRQIRPLPLEEGGLSQALEQLTRHHEELYQVPVKTKVERLPEDLPYPVAAFTYHAARELLFNAIKHAHPTCQWLSLEFEPGKLRLEVRDDGVGAHPDEFRASGNGSSGIAAIHQRLRAFGGRLDVDSGPHKGTAVTITLPIQH